MNGAIVAVLPAESQYTIGKAAVRSDSRSRRAQQPHHAGKRPDLERRPQPPPQQVREPVRHGVDVGELRDPFGLRGRRCSGSMTQILDVALKLVEVAHHQRIEQQEDRDAGEPVRAVPRERRGPMAGAASALAGRRGDSRSAIPISGADERRRVLRQRRRARGRARSPRPPTVSPRSTVRTRKHQATTREERHADVEAEEVRVAQVDARRTPGGTRRSTPASRPRHAARDVVDERDGRGAERRGNRAAQHHVGDFVARER